MPPKTLAPLVGDLAQPPPSAPTALVFGIGQSTLRRAPAAPRPATTDVNVLSPMASMGTMNATTSSTASNPFTGYYSNNYASSGEVATSVDRQLAALKEKRRLRQQAFDSPAANSPSSASVVHGALAQSPAPSSSSPIPAPPPPRGGGPRGGLHLHSSEATHVSMPPIGQSRVPRTPPGSTHSPHLPTNDGSASDAKGASSESALRSFPRRQYLTTQAPDAEEEGGDQRQHAEKEEGDGGEVLPKKAVAVSAATLKRRQAMEEKAKAAANATDGKASPAGQGQGLEGKRAAPWRKTKGGAAAAEAPVVAPPPPPPAERCRRIEEILLMLQCKGAQAAALMEAAVANEGGPKGKGAKGGGAADGAKGMAPTASYEWMCHERGLSDLRTEVLDRWLRRDTEQRMALAARHLGAPVATDSTTCGGADGRGGASPAEAARIASPSAVPNRRKAPAPTPNSIPPSVSARAFFTSNALLRAYRDTVLLPPPTAAGGADGRSFAKAHPSDVLNAAGATMFFPTDREVGLLLGGATPIVRACLACSDNGRSTVSKLGVEVMGLLGDALGVARLHGYYAQSTATTAEQYAALMCSPSSRALDRHADALLSTLITKGGTASVKFLYEVSAAALFQLLRGVGGSGNKVLVGVLLQSLGSNVPKTEKSRVLWGDAVAFSLVQRWSMSFLAPALNAAEARGLRAPRSSPSSPLGPASLPEHPSLPLILTAVIATGTAASSQSLEDLPRAVATALRAVAEASPSSAVGDPAGISAAEGSWLTLATTARDMRELLTRALPVIDTLLADGSAEVREAGRRVLLALLLLHEEHAAANGYSTVGSCVGATPSSSPSRLAAPAQSPPSAFGPYLSPAGGLVPHLVPSACEGLPRMGREVATPSTPGAQGKDAVPTIDSLIARTFADAKARQDRMREALQWARQAYSEGLVPLVLCFAHGGAKGAKPPQHDAPSFRSPRLTTPVLPKARGASPATPSAAASPYGAATFESRHRTPPAEGRVKSPQSRGARPAGLPTIAGKPPRSREATPRRGASREKGDGGADGGKAVGRARSRDRSGEEKEKGSRPSSRPPTPPSDGSPSVIPAISVTKGRPPRAAPSAAATPTAAAQKEKEVAKGGSAAGDARRTSRMLRAGVANATSPSALLIAQLQLYIEGQGPSSRGQVGSRGATPGAAALLAGPPSAEEVMALPLSADQKELAREWAAAGVPLPISLCAVALRSSPPPPASFRDRDRETALRYLLHGASLHEQQHGDAGAGEGDEEGVQSVPLPYAVGTALMDALLSRTTHSNHRIHGMCLQLLLRLCAASDGSGDDSGGHPLAFSVPHGCVDAVCGKGIGYLTTAMASSSGVVAGAATEVVRRLVAVVAGMLSGADDNTSVITKDDGSGCAICSLKSLLHDLVSTAYATRNPSARAALLGVAASEVVLKAAAAVTAADVRFAADTCASIVATEVTELGASASKAAVGAANLTMTLGGTASVLGRLRTPAGAASSCLAAMRVLSAMGQCGDAKVRAVAPSCWEGVIAPAVRGYLTSAAAAAVGVTARPSPPPAAASRAAPNPTAAANDDGEEAYYEDDFEASGNGEEEARRQQKREEEDAEKAAARREALAALNDLAGELSAQWAQHFGSKAVPSPAGAKAKPPPMPSPLSCEALELWMRGVAGIAAK